jgi:hypothetical protein
MPNGQTRYTGRRWPLSRRWMLALLVPIVIVANIGITWALQLFLQHRDASWALAIQLDTSLVLLLATIAYVITTFLALQAQRRPREAVQTQQQYNAISDCAEVLGRADPSLRRLQEAFPLAGAYDSLELQDRSRVLADLGTSLAPIAFRLPPEVRSPAQRAMRELGDAHATIGRLVTALQQEEQASVDEKREFDEEQARRAYNDLTDAANVDGPNWRLVKTGRAFLSTFDGVKQLEAVVSSVLNG